MSNQGVVRAVGFLVSLAAFVLVRALTRGLPWWLSVLLAIVAMVLAGRLAGVVAIDVAGRLARRRGGPGGPGGPGRAGGQARGAVRRS